MQSSDQTLARTNEAIAWSCMVWPVSDHGGEAGERWKEGKPVCVVSAHKLKKLCHFALKEGFRYDGIYKVKESSSNTQGAKKRKSSDDGREEEEPPKKVGKLYKMADEWAELIKADTRNKSLWDQVLEKEMYSRTGSGSNCDDLSNLF